MTPDATVNITSRCYNYFHNFHNVSHENEIQKFAICATESSQLLESKTR